MIKILIAEDMHMVRGALVALLELEPDLRVVAELASGNEILPAVRERHPDVAVIDIDLPGEDGLTAAAEIHDTGLGCRTLVLTSLGRPGTVRRALAARVNGFMLKDAPSDNLANAIREAHVGRRVIDGELALAAWDTETLPADRQGDRDPPARGGRPHRQGYRSAPVPVRRHHPELPHGHGVKAQRPQPG